jgi:DNA-binding winged helix-turn-helix (wHTH) protein/tetratricopeptide (TPR) repeat protein
MLEIVQAEQHRLFPPFRLDPVNQQLWRGAEEIILRPKTFEVLRYLVDHAARLVTKTDLLDTIWGKVAVSDSMPALCISELRKALDDTTKMPRFIETLHRRGYRFIANVTTAPPSLASINAQALSPAYESTIVGRDAELAQLQTWYSQSLSGKRQIVFVGGEIGIGKTAFVRAFLNSIASDGTRFAHGQCLEHYGAGEPYMPVLEALTQLSRDPVGGDLPTILGRLAPTWLAQMPALSSELNRGLPQRQTPGATQQRMLREMAQAMEELAAATPLVLFLEDLHWSDFSTLDLLSALAHRFDPARLLVIGTYRPVEMLASAHPLRTVKDELTIHRRCNELQLKLLGLDDVLAYLARRFGKREPLDPLARAIQSRTQGNPLFIVNVVDYLLAQGILAPNGATAVESARRVDASRIDVPPTLVETIERNLERLTSEEQLVLEAASVAGTDFSAAAVAAALGRQAHRVDACCTRLARRKQFVDRRGISEWPDGTITTKYRFLHTFYQEVLYERSSVSSRAQLHRRIARRQEDAYGELANDIAAELAYHYQRANYDDQAVRYLLVAGERALRSFSNHEAETHLRSVLRIIEKMPQTEERYNLELRAMKGLHVAVSAVRGIGFGELGLLLARTGELCRRLGRRAEFIHTLWANAHHHMYLGNMHKAVEIGMEAVAVAVAERADDPAQLALARDALGNAYFYMGHLLGSRAELERALNFDPAQHRHARGISLMLLSRALWILGFPDQARMRNQQCLESAQHQEDPFVLAEALAFGGDVSYYRGEAEDVKDRTSAVATLLAAMESEHPQLIGWTRMLDGWVHAQRGQPQDALALTRNGYDVVRANRQRIAMPIFGCLMAGVQATAGLLGEALRTVEQTIEVAEETAQHYSDSELQRLRGEFLLMCPDGCAQDAERCFHKAIEIARGQQAKSWELRATMSLARLLASQGHRDEARSMLAEIYNWFTEGFDTADLKDAKALLDEL